ncbi:GGDEF domain-containing protein [Roseibium denhamense]|uniref:Diguanylate cyclase (GGDEF) domain-containing protein n=1 Tax=Roseibium denhamense TaxID=76305 RepID=A0ABY1PHS9_9HYPH|nr:bifunctional diguanylate cyclase/phosphodiesterase [Roseibium denhamense]MTI05012.1 GGDEF domain-containing protein [Roseibium denhamense]SMP33175.1 diguanylate cyclase (GGDEF) domain-containing protein [Roseibium denhamense]
MRWRQTLSSSKVYLIAGICVFGSAMALNFMFFDSSYSLIQNAMRYDAVWTGSGGRIEAETLKSSFSTYLLTQAEADKKELKLRFAITKGRLNSWAEGTFGKSIKEVQGGDRMLADAKRLLGSLQVFINAPPPPTEREAVARKVAKAVDAIHKLGHETQQYSMVQAALARDQIKRQQNMQRAINEGLSVVGALLFLLAIWQNASLRRASNRADATARKYERLAKHDVVTGLANRATVEEKLAALSRMVQKPRVCVLAADLDGFKRINDLMGHVAGDAALKAAAEKMQAMVDGLSSTRLVARVGGDEFLIVLEMYDLEWSLSAFAHQLIKAFEEPIYTDVGTVNLGVSIGYAESRCDKENCVHLVMNADLALTEAKSTGKSRAIAYKDTLRIQMYRRQEVESALKEAVKNHDIYPVFQSYHDILTGTCLGFEALARWCHKELGPIGPDEFIPTAETTGDIINLGALILDDACLEAAGWREKASVSVNLSTVQFLRPGLVKDVSNALAKSRLEPSRLKLEVTESVLISDKVRTLSILQELQKTGTRIVLDDFGTGYSSLSYLVQFPWDEIKIDRSFVETAGTYAEMQNVVSMVVRIASQLGAVVTIEGIETEAQRALFSGFGCHMAQGYFYGRPQKLDKLPGLVDQRATLRAIS